MKVAVASGDGKVINQHFGRATQFLIFELGQDGYQFLELRKNEPICATSEHEGHNLDRLEWTLNLISDCQAVLCSRIGLGVKEVLREKDIEAIEMPYPIEDALQMLLERKIG